MWRGVQHKLVLVCSIFALSILSVAAIAENEPVVETRAGPETVTEPPLKYEDSVNLHNQERRLHIPNVDCDAGENCPEIIKKERKFDFLFEFDFFSQYVSKGLPSSDGAVWQPSITVEAYNVGLSVWSNFVLDDEPNQGQFNEVDFTPYYNLTIGNFNFIPAVNFMVFPNKDPASLDYSAHNIIRPQWHMAYEIGYFTPYADGFYYPYPTKSWGTYHDIGVLFQYKPEDLLEIATSVQFAIGGDKWNASRIADVGTVINNFEYVLSLNFATYKGFSVSPVMHVVITLPKGLRNNMDEPDYIWGGLTLKYDL